MSDREKVFCKDCSHLLRPFNESFYRCMAYKIPYTNSMQSGVMLGNPSEKNANNNCKDHQKKTSFLKRLFG